MSLDPNETFSNKFLGRLQGLEETCLSTARTLLPKGITTARNLRDLVAVLQTVVSRLGLGDPSSTSKGRSSDSLRVVYVYKAGSSISTGHRIEPSIAYSGRVQGDDGHSGNGGRVNNAQRPPRYHPYASNEKTRPSRQPQHKSGSRLQVFHEHHAIYDKQLVDHEIAFMLKFWHAQRTTSGPMSPAEIKSKCRPCAFSQQCPH